MNTERWPNVLVFTLVMQLVVDITIILDIPIVRQVVGFLYLTFIPGIAILYTLKLKNLELAEVILFSAGVSLSILMIAGLLLNELGPLLHIFTPLSLMPIIVLFNCIVLCLCFYNLVKQRATSFSLIQETRLSIIVILLMCLPLLSVLGALSVITVPMNNLLLLFAIVAISLLVIFIIFSRKRFAPKYYIFVLLSIAVTLLLQFSMVSNGLYGADIQHEYVTVRYTENNAYWNSTFLYKDNSYRRTNSMLSVTILPTIYSTVLNIEGTWTLKVVYPLIFALVPLGLYVLYKQYINEKGAFLSVFFFMSNFIFFTEMLGLAKQMIAELFFVLLFIVLMNKKMRSMDRKIFFMLFGTALVLSHYSTSFIFTFLIVSGLLYQFIFKKKNMRITASMVVIFLVIQFSWYVYVSDAGPFTELVLLLERIQRRFFADFFNQFSRGEAVLKGVGLGEVVSSGHLVGRGLFYVTEFFILLGFIFSLIIRRNNYFDHEYMLFSSLNIVLLIGCIVVPNFSRSLNMTRFYHILLIFLAPFCILGGKKFFGFIFKGRSKPYILLLIILIPFFLYQTEFVYEITGDESWSIPISRYRMSLTRQRSLAVTHEQDIFSTRWLTTYVEVEPTHVYATNKFFTLCGGYGMLDIYAVRSFTNGTELLDNSTIYISWTELFFDEGGVEYEVMNNFDKTYSNGDSEIYKNGS